MPNRMNVQISSQPPEGANQQPAACRRNSAVNRLQKTGERTCM